MLEIIGILLLIFVAWIILKYTMGFMVTYFSLTISLFIGIGFIMFVLSALANLVSTGTAWAITLVPTIIALIYDIKGMPSNPEDMMDDVKKTLKHKHGYDENGKEIDYFKGEMCCGNCTYNTGRPSSFSLPRCHNSSRYNKLRWDFHDLSEDRLRKVKSTDYCEYWEHF